VGTISTTTCEPFGGLQRGQFGLQRRLLAGLERARGIDHMRHQRRHRLDRLGVGHCGQRHKAQPERNRYELDSNM
jgi:hypothetical protein